MADSSPSRTRVQECLELHDCGNALVRIRRYEAGFGPRVTLRDCAWSAGRLVVDMRVDLETVGADGVARPVRFRRRGQRLLRLLPAEVTTPLGHGVRRRVRDALDVSAEVTRASVAAVLRDVDGDTEVIVPGVAQVEATPPAGGLPGTCTLRYAVTAMIDAGGFDPAMTPSTWDVDLAFAVCGLRGRSPVGVPDDLDMDPRHSTARLPGTGLEVTALISPPPARLRLHLRPGLTRRADAMEVLTTHCSVAE